jgi:hypothetical protein
MGSVLYCCDFSAIARTGFLFTPINLVIDQKARILHDFLGSVFGLEPFRPELWGQTLNQVI